LAGMSCRCRVLQASHFPHFATLGVSARAQLRPSQPRLELLDQCTGEARRVLWASFRLRSREPCRAATSAKPSVAVSALHPVDAFSERLAGFWLCEAVRLRVGADVWLTICNA